MNNIRRVDTFYIGKERPPAFAAPLRWLVLDLNGFFASCEQQDNPRLRGRAVGVVPTMADTTCIIAASYAAKQKGIRTGTKVSDAKRLCPGIALIQARPKRYVEYHHKILGAIEKIIPVVETMSIDEVACRLDKSEEDNIPAIRTLSARIKNMIRHEAGACLTSSIGVAANVLLAKLASDMEKPDGFTVLAQDSLLERIAHLDLQDIPGIGSGMKARLVQAGITSIPALFAAERGFLRRIWGGVAGARFHALLHGADLPRVKNARSSICHQHVMAPYERTIKACTPVLRQLLTRAAFRLREEKLFCTHLAIDVKWTQHMGYWGAERRFKETQETGFLLQALEEAWRAVPQQRALRIGVTLSGFADEARHQPDLFDVKPKKREGDASLNAAMDALNKKYGRGTLGYGAPNHLSHMTSKIAFSRVPKMSEF